MMPRSAYFQGHGDEVMRSMMKARHGDRAAAEREFYATANAQGAKPGHDMAELQKGLAKRPRQMKRRKG